jgi:hypothetical protein
VGEAAKGRFSIYLDPENRFTLSVLDTQGELYTVRVPSGASGVPLNEFIYLSCEVGTTDKSTSLRVLVNAREVSTLVIPFKIELGALDLKGGMIGADLNSQNNESYSVQNVSSIPNS